MYYYSLFLKLCMILELTQFLMLFSKEVMGSLFVVTNSLDVPHKMAIIWPDTFGKHPCHSRRIVFSVR
jgi:hypothetical protein